MVFENSRNRSRRIRKRKEEIKLNTNIQEDLEADSLDLFKSLTRSKMNSM